MNQPEKKSNKKVIIIVLVVLGVLGLSALVCCGLSVFYGVGAVGDMEKAYYAECEDLQDTDACKQCCADRGHDGHIHGNLINDEGKMCGCLL